MTRSIDRRTMLRGAGTAIALPFFQAMSAHANGLAGTRILPTNSGSEIPNRTAFFYVPNGMHMPDWTPSSTGSEFELPRTLQPLQDFRTRLNVLSGLTLDGARAHGDGPGDHARSVASFLTGAHPRKTSGAGILNGASVDQVMASHIGQNTRLASLEIGMEGSAPAGRCDSGYSCVYTSNISWRTETTPVAKEVNPAALFDRLFGSEDGRQSKQMAAKRRKYHKSILDYARGDARRLHGKLGSDDRRKLDEYLYAVRDVEKRIDNSEKLDQIEIEVPDYPRPEGVPRDYAEHMKLLYDVMTLALQTDSTRVMTFMYANAGSNRSYRSIGVRDGHHDLSHHGNNKEKQSKISDINRYHMQLFSYFLKRLNSVSEGEGTLLDHCTFVYGSGIADGNRHAHHALPVLTIGNAGGSIHAGRHIKFADETPMTNLYLTLLNSAGVAVDRFGDSTGPLAELKYL